MRPLDRREFMKYAGLGAMCATLVRRFTPSALAAGNARKLIIFHTPNGIVGSKRAEILNELGEHQSALTILNNVTFSGTGDHKTGMPFCTTGYIAANGGISLDQAVAAGIGEGRPSLVVSGKSYNQNYRGYISQDSSGAWVPPISSPKTAFESVFGPIGSSPSTPPPTSNESYSAEVERQILDAAVADANALRARLPQSEVIKMDDQLAALMRLKSLTQGAGGTAPPLTANCSVVDGSPFAVSAPSYDEKLDLLIDLIAISFACDARRVASFQIAPGGHDGMSYSAAQTGEAIGGDIHNGIAHHFAESDANQQKMLSIEKYEARKLKRLVARLKELSVWNDTVILWTNEVGSPNHGHTNIPVYVLSGSHIALAKGAQIDAQGYNYPKILLTLAHAVGHTSLSSFGNPSHNGNAVFAPLMT